MTKSKAKSPAKPPLPQTGGSFTRTSKGDLQKAVTPDPEPQTNEEAS